MSSKKPTKSKNPKNSKNIKTPKKPQKKNLNRRSMTHIPEPQKPPMYTKFRHPSNSQSRGVYRRLRSSSNNNPVGRPFSGDFSPVTRKNSNNNRFESFKKGVSNRRVNNQFTKLARNRAQKAANNRRANKGFTNLARNRSQKAAKKKNNNTLQSVFQSVVNEQQQYENSIVGFYQNNVMLSQTIIQMIENISRLLKDFEGFKYTFKNVNINNFVNNILVNCITHAYTLYKREPIKLPKSTAQKVNNIGNILNNSRSSSKVKQLKEYNQSEPYVSTRREDPLFDKLYQLQKDYEQVCSYSGIDCSISQPIFQLQNPFSIKGQSFYPRIESEEMLREYMAQDVNRNMLLPHLHQNNSILNIIYQYLTDVYNYLNDVFAIAHRNHVSRVEAESSARTSVRIRPSISNARDVAIRAISP